MRCLIDNKFLAGWHWNLAFKAWFVSNLIETPEDRFSQNEAHMVSYPEIVVHCVGTFRGMRSLFQNSYVSFVCFV